MVKEVGVCMDKKEYFHLLKLALSVIDGKHKQNDFKIRLKAHVIP